MFYKPVGPTKCGNNNLPTNFTFNSNEKISGNITLCGKPQPTMSWMAGDQSINGSVDLTKADQHQYTYSFKQRITSDMCGKYISYKATAFHTVTGFSLVFLKNCKTTLTFFFQIHL